eukprot:SAG22_NODE_606_length_8615_cov_6.190348_4_plen_121_part_00
MIVVLVWSGLVWPAEVSDPEWVAQFLKQQVSSKALSPLVLPLELCLKQCLSLPSICPCRQGEVPGRPHVRCPEDAVVERVAVYTFQSKVASCGRYCRSHDPPLSILLQIPMTARFRKGVS